MSLSSKTPSRTRTLGLRRTPITKTPSATMAKEFVIKTPDNKVLATLAGSKSVSNTNHETTPTKNSSTAVTQSAPSTSEAPFTLSLSKRIRDTLTRKRLEFQAARERGKAEIVVVPVKKIKSVHDLKEKSENSPAAMPYVINKVEEKAEVADDTQKRSKLIQELEVFEEEMQARQRHISKTLELQSIIDQWQSGFHSSLNDLQQSIQPYKKKLVLLNSLGIDENLLKTEDNSDDE